MKYVVPAPKPEPKLNMIDVTDKPDLLEAADLDHCFARVIPDPVTGRKYMPVTDVHKVRGKDVEIPIT